LLTTGLLLVHFTAPVAADVATAAIMPANDAGVIIAPPRQFTPVQVTCGSVHQRAVLVHNPSDTDQNPSSLAVRIGTSRVRAYPANKKNGLRLPAGQTTTWDIANGPLYAVSEGSADAGVTLGVICVYGGQP
jgi:hypothetical protein